MPSLSTAIHFCFASYYIFNISFPTAFKSILLFLEKYVYGLKSSQKLPMSVVLVHDGMERLNSCMQQQTSGVSGMNHFAFLFLIIAALFLYSYTKCLPLLWSSHAWYK